MTLKKHDRNLFKTIITEHLKYLAKAVMRRSWELSLIGILMFCLIISSDVYAASNVSTMEKDPDTEHALFYDASHNNINPLESESYYPLKASYAIEDEATTSDSDGTVEGFITRLYEAFLGRKPDEGGLRAWSDSLKSRKTTGAKVVYRFVYSDEFRNNPLNNSECIRLYLGEKATKQASPHGSTFLNVGVLEKKY